MKTHLLLPITVRQAQKVAHKGKVRLSKLATLIGVEPDRYLVLSQLARLAAKDPNQLIGDFNFEAGANPPSDAQPLPEEQEQAGDNTDSQNNNISQPQGEGSGTPQTDSGMAVGEHCSENGYKDSTSESKATAKNSPIPTRWVDQSPNTALGENNRTDGKGGEESVQSRDTDAQESSDSLPNAPDDRAGDTDPIETESETGDSDQADQPADAPQHQKKWGKKFKRQGKSRGQLSATGKHSHGGTTAKLGKEIDRSLVQLCRSRLGALVGDNSQNPSFRRDYAEFCTRLKTYRNPAPARKEEEGRATILLMADVSESCSSFSKEALKVAKAASHIGVAGADILIIGHSNGYPEEMEVNGKPIGVDKISDPGPQNSDWGALLEFWYTSLIKRYPIEVVVAIGDWDAIDVYRFLVSQAKVNRFIWLDHANKGLGVRDCTEMALGQFPNPQGIRHKFVYRQGCKNAKQFVENIKE